MENFVLVQHKLKSFIKKYYLNEILKGSLLFLAIGLIYFLLVVGLENILWLSILGRTILFWVFISVELFLLIRFIGFPLAKLFKISKGIDDFKASEIIGKHFPEVNDKLKNLLQLKNNSRETDLLLASIEQRSKELRPVPFTSAVDFKKNRKHIKYVIFPVLIIVGLLVAGKADYITKSFSRIADYNTVYLKPAPFRFTIQNDKLSTREGENFKLQVKTIGDYNPDIIQLIEGENRNFMKQVAPGVFEFTFSELSEDVKFSLISNEVTSPEYSLEVVKVPKLLDFEMAMDYPAYTGLKDNAIKGTGNLTVPEGTEVKWNFTTQNTGTINFKTDDSLYTLASQANTVDFQKIIRSNLPYAVSTSNSRVKDFEKLTYEVKVIKDQYPEIKVMGQTDSLNTDIQYFKGDVSDDYGLKGVELIYYEENKEDSASKVIISVSEESFDEFHYSFPGNLELNEGTNYLFYFRVFDNDAVNGSKSAKSETFSFRKKSREEIKTETLEDQNKAIENISERLNEFEKSEEDLKQISRIEKEEEELNYNERKKLEEYLKRQKQQNTMMKSYSEKLEKSIKQQENENSSPMQKELSERLQKNEERLEENEALLKELEQYSEKIKKEELGKKLEELSKQNKNNKRSLEQLLELTKGYYVEEKKQKLAGDLQNLSEKQEKISEQKEENNVENQKELNEKFEEFQNQMNELEKENKNLKEPKDLGREKEGEESIKKEQQEATDKLQENNKNDAQENQKNAAKKMKQMSGAMQQMGMQQQMQQLEADSETLRQILDNLIVFSFEQEDLLNDFKTLQQNNPSYATRLREQSNLRENFRHVDDSLYSLALKNPMINEAITDKLTDVEFDLEKSIDRLSENEIPQGTASQQYVVTGANDLANLLDSILSSMQEMIASAKSGGQGSGKSSGGEGGKEFQLQDIVKKQEELGDRMEKEAGEQKGQQEGKSTKNGGEGENGKLYEIYKEQQMLRMQMEKLLEQNGIDEGSNPVKNMKQIEEQLLDKGFDPETAKRMKQLQYELLKFEEAHKLQGTDDKRKAETNQIIYKNSLQNQIDTAKEYFNSTEILNRQTLPLRQIYKEKVKEYFGKGRN